MTSALSPRDIQSRIRSGASLEDVAREAEVPVEKVEPFAAPVLAEREHVAGTALQCPVRRRGETGSVRAMRQVVAEKLGTKGLEVDDVAWDAWRNEDRRWTVVGRWSEGEGDDAEAREARFVFDQRARFSTAQDDQARWLIGEFVPSQQPESPDAEPTIDLNDELAIVRAVQGGVPLVEPPASDGHKTVVNIPEAHEPHGMTAVPKAEAAEPQQPGGQSQPRTEASQDSEPDASASHDASRQAADAGPQPMAVVGDQAGVGGNDETDADDYDEDALQEVDGVYDFVPKNTSDMDVLYEMLSSFAEDSVNIYAGLTNPVAPQQGPAGELDPQDDAQVAQRDWVDEQADEDQDVPALRSLSADRAHDGTQDEAAEDKAAHDEAQATHHVEPQLREAGEPVEPEEDPQRAELEWEPVGETEPPVHLSAPDTANAPEASLPASGEDDDVAAEPVLAAVEDVEPEVAPQQRADQATADRAETVISAPVITEPEQDELPEAEPTGRIEIDVVSMHVDVEPTSATGGKQQPEQSAADPTPATPDAARTESTEPTRASGGNSSRPEPIRVEPRPEPIRVEARPEPIRVQPRQEPIRVEPRPEPIRVQPRTEPIRVQPRDEETQPQAESAQQTQPVQQEAAQQQAATQSTAVPSAEVGQTRATTQQGDATPASDKPEQDALVDGPEPAAPRPKPKSRKKRASVPSWDEIMFGGPSPKK